jgi:hypothetical protein
MNATDLVVSQGERDLDASDPVVNHLLERMLEASQDNVDILIGAVQRVARELSSLSFNYNGHMIRAGMRSPELQDLDHQLDEASTVLGRTLFDLQQRLLGDVHALRPLRRIFEVADLEDERPAVTRLRERLDAYCEDLERQYQGISETLAALSFRLALMGNNIEIAACRAGGQDVMAPVDLFCVMANQLRSLADRLRNTTADLRIFQQSQNGYAESMRLALINAAGGVMA